MAKRKPRKKTSTKSAKAAKTVKSVRAKIKASGNQAKQKVEEVIDQVKEPLSLLNTLKEEGMASAMTFLTVASSAMNTLKSDAVSAQLKEVVFSLGFASKADIERLEDRIDELQQKLTERELADEGYDESPTEDESE